MRILLQRVTRASVSVDQRVVGSIGHGLVALVGVGQGDAADDAARMADKVARLRIFNDADGRFNRSVLDVRGGALVISQFTLYADARRGRRPGFTEAAAPELAAPLCEAFALRLGEQGVVPVETGVFGATMQVEIHNQGPVTIWLDSRQER